MTDITKELKDYQQFGPKSVLDKLNQEKNEIKEKIHVINVFTVIAALKDMVNNNEFSNYKAESIVVNYYRDNDNSSNISFELKDEKGQELSNYNAQDRQTSLTIKAMNIFKLIEANLDFFQPGYAAFKTDEDHTFKLSNAGIDEMKKKFLNDKLQTSISYAMLDNCIPEEKKSLEIKTKL